MTEETRPNEQLVSIFVAPDEMTASIVYGLLESEGIDAMVQPARTVWGDRAALIGAMPSDGQWGEILVFEKDAELSRELIEAYNAEDETPPTASGSQDGPWAQSYSPRVFRIASGMCASYAIIMGYVAWAGSAHGRLLFALIASFTLLTQGLIMVSSAKYVPTRYLSLHMQCYNGMLAAAVVFGVLAAGEMGAFELSPSAEITICTLIAVVAAYGLLKDYNFEDERQEDERVE